MRAVSLLGAPIVRAILVALVSGGLVMRRRFREAILVVVGVGGVGALNTLLKVIIRRRRPHHLWLHAPAKSSFPSGHASGTLTFCGIAFYLIQRSRADRLIVIVAGALLPAVALLVGVSRVLLGRHHLTDVLGGYLLGGIWLTLSIRILGRRGAEEHDRGDEGGRGRSR